MMKEKKKKREAKHLRCFLMPFRFIFHLFKKESHIVNIVSQLSNETCSL